MRTVQPLPLAAAVAGAWLVLGIDQAVEAGAESDRPDRSMSGRLLARGGCYRAFPASSLRIEVRRMLSLTRWLIVALALFATGGVSFSQPLEVEAAR